MKRAEPEKSYKILSIDPWLTPYRRDIQLRMDRFTDIRKKLLGPTGDLVSMANGYLYYGIHRTESGWIYREWAPGADQMHLIGSFNGWNRESHPMTKLPAGNWEIELSADALRHKDLVKVQVTRFGVRTDHIPAVYPQGRAGRREHLRAGLGAEGSVPLDGRRIWAPEDQPVVHLRGARRHGAGGAAHRHLSGIRRPDPPPHQGGRLQRRCS